MTLTGRFQEEVDRLGHGGPYTVELGYEGNRLICDMVEQWPLACKINFLTLKTSTLASSTIKDLESLCQTLASQITYLLEPIGRIERDSQTCSVQMRSCPPQQDEEGSHYYELLVKYGGELTLSRYEKRLGGAQIRCPYILTKEVLLRLLNDFVNATGSFGLPAAEF